MLLLMVVAVTWDLGFHSSPLHSKEVSKFSWNVTLYLDLTKANKGCKLELSKNE